MNKSNTQEAFSYTDAEFLELIKDDPVALKEYRDGLIEICRDIYNRKEKYSNEKLTKWYAKQMIKKPLEYFSFMEMMQLNLFLNFIRNVPNPEHFLKPMSQNLKSVQDPLK